MIDERQIVQFYSGGRQQHFMIDMARAAAAQIFNKRTPLF